MTHRFRFATWIIKPDSGEIENGSLVQHLEPKLMQLLVCLMENQGQVQTRANLLERVWEDTHVSDEVLTTAISKLRRILGDTSRKSIIQTVPKKGYRMVVPVHRIATSTPLPQPKWDSERGNPKPTADYPVWPMALITALALCLSVFWWRGGFDLNDFQMATALPQPMTSLPGRETDAAISPDGNYLAFSWAQEGKSEINLFLKDLRTEAIHQLTKNASIDYSPAWAPDGKRLAFIRREDQASSVFMLHLPTKKEYMLHRLFASRSKGLSWSPNGELLAFSDRQAEGENPGIMVVELYTGYVKKISQPPTHVMGDYFPRFSPGGNQLAFIRKESPGIGHVYTTDLRGNSAQVAALNGALRGVEWLSDHKLLFASDHSGPSALMWVDIHEKVPTPFPGMAYNAARPTVSPGGHYLTFETVHENADIVSFSLEDPVWPDPAPPRALIASSRWDSTPQFSPDGTRIAFSSSRKGRSQIWVSDASGRNLRQLTNMASGFTSAPRWSPDGQTIAFDTRPLRDNKVQIFTIGIEGGEAKKISDGTSNDLLPTWSASGEHLYFRSTRDDQEGLWRMPSEGGSPELVTRNSSMMGLEDSSGDAFYYVNLGDDSRLWRLDLATGEEKRFMEDRLSIWGNWTLTQKGIYFLKDKDKSQVSLEFRAWSSTCTKSLRTLSFIPENLGFALSPTEKTVVVVKRQPPEGDIMLLPLH